MRLPFDFEDRELDVVLDENREVSRVSEESSVLTDKHTYIHTDHPRTQTDRQTNYLQHLYYQARLLPTQGP